jgi:thiamine biosynthesis lipoprotein ApbE
VGPADGIAPPCGVAATVVAAEGWQAEVLAKAAFLAGLPEGLRLLGSMGTDGLLVDDQGSPCPSAGFGRFTRRARERAG